MHAITLTLDDSIYKNFLSFLEMLPKDKAKIVDDSIIHEPNEQTKRVLLEVRNGKNVEEFDITELKR